MKLRVFRILLAAISVTACSLWLAAFAAGNITQETSAEPAGVTSEEEIKKMMEEYPGYKGILLKLGDLKNSDTLELESEDQETINTEYKTRRILLSEKDDVYSIQYEARLGDGTYTEKYTSVYFTLSETQPEGDKDESVYTIDYKEDGTIGVKTQPVVFDKEGRLRVSMKKLEDDSEVYDLWVPREYMYVVGKQEESADTTASESESEAETVATGTSVTENQQEPDADSDAITFELPDDLKNMKLRKAKVVLEMSYNSSEKKWLVAEEDGAPAIQVVDSSFVVIKDSPMVFWGVIVLMAAVLVSIGVNCFLIITRNR